ELLGDGFVRPRRRRRKMPRPSVWITVPVGRAGQGKMRRPALPCACRAVYRRAHERMPESHAAADRKQPVVLGRGHGGGGRHPSAVGGAPQQQRIAERLGGGEQEQLTAVLGKRLQAPREALL